MRMYIHTYMHTIEPSLAISATGRMAWTVNKDTFKTKYA